jgi:hypothetical protein
MNLVTVASPDFALRAINLVESFLRFGGRGRILLCHFGDVSESFLRTVCDHYGERLACTEVERTCAHAHNPRFYFFKAYALQAAMRLREPFAYLDAASVFLAPVDDLERLLHERSRVFVQYPTRDVFKNARWTTAACLRKMGCDEDRFKNAHVYVAGFQAYVPTPDNASFVEEIFRLMHDPEIAGPSNWQMDPDGNGVCQAHRNDQSVLSLLIERRGWHQPFELEHFVRYGDVLTLEALTPELLVGTEGITRTVVPRFHRLDFVPPALLGKLNQP